MFMAAAHYAPDWRGWRLVCAVTIEQAVALSMGIDPGLLHSWKFWAHRNALVEFENRRSMARRWGLRGPFSIAAHYEGREQTIYLRAFVRYAISAGWDLPAALAELAPRDDHQPQSELRPEPGPKGGEQSVNQLAWEIASKILDSPDRPARRHGRLIALARKVNIKLASQGYNRQDESIRKAIGPSLREWETANPDK